MFTLKEAICLVLQFEKVQCAAKNKSILTSNILLIRPKPWPLQGRTFKGCYLRFLIEALAIY